MTKTLLKTKGEKKNLDYYNTEKKSQQSHLDVQLFTLLNSFSYIFHAVYIEITKSELSDGVQFGKQPLNTCFVQKLKRLPNPLVIKQLHKALLFNNKIIEKELHFKSYD